jgi:hypothetical protein
MVAEAKELDSSFELLFSGGKFHGAYRVAKRLLELHNLLQVKNFTSMYTLMLLL